MEGMRDRDMALGGGGGDRAADGGWVDGGGGGGWQRCGGDITHMF